MEHNVITKLKELHSQGKLYKKETNEIDWVKVYEVERDTK